MTWYSEAVSGAKLVIRNSDDEVMESWATDGTPHLLNGYGDNRSLQVTKHLQLEGIGSDIGALNAVCFSV